VINFIGAVSLAAACALTLVGIAAALRAARHHDGAALRQAEQIAVVIFILLTLATAVMVYALVLPDFSVSYVAQVGSRATPTFFAVLSLWGALEGSLLLWGWILAVYTALVAWRTPARVPVALKGYALAILLGIGTFFYYLLVGPASPFGAVSPVPLDGPGPNPLLQNHWLMAVHPPLLYLGYVGFSVPFAFAMGSLLAGQHDSGWIQLTRRWTLWSWAFLTAAIVAGMWWAYEVLGWGGYWAWDPVENASLMPWLTATAFLHSVMMQERRGMLRVWNLNLVAATFLLTILGTFLTRSGILSSVHAFAGGEIGYWFLGFLGVGLAFSLALVAGRAVERPGGQGLEAVASRDTLFLVNNLLLSVFTFTVLLGTMFPLVAEAVRGVKVSVGAPFFNRMTVPLCVALIFLMGVGPLLPWGRAALDEVRRRLLAPGLALVLVLLISLVVRVPSAYGVLLFAFGAFALVSNGQEFVLGTLARMRAHGEGALVALHRLTRANRHRYGGYLAHVGVVVFAVGVAASSVYRAETEATLQPGQALSYAGYDLRLEGIWVEEQPQRVVVGADVALARGGRSLGVMHPRLNFYGGREEPVSTPAVRTRLEDVYLNLRAFEGDGSSATLMVLVEPLVVWIWVGTLIVLLGAAFALWPERRRTPTAGLGRGPPRVRRRRELAGAEQP
jgi:cytochrome c-type biogenesis protein CcmF